jgi:membrane protease YdiL (CAAX protease family)
MFAPHPAFPPDMTGGVEALTPGVLFGMQLRGQWWVIGVYFIGWVFNILGEEFWYRGWMLPRQELAFGRFAWIVNGVIFTFQHTLQPWNYLMILPGALFMVYVIQRRRNTWIGIIQHGLLNISLLLFAVQGVVS